MQRILFITALLVAGCHASQKEISLASPEGWAKETFSLPPEFDAFFPFHGKEIIRFAPGWADKAKPDYWSYAFLWRLDHSPDLTTEMLEKAFTGYYNGLESANIKRRQIAPEKIIPVQVHLDARPGSAMAWSGTVIMLDYMAQVPMTLHIAVREMADKVPGEKTLFIEVSPVSPGEGIWQDMDRLVG